MKFEDKVKYLFEGNNVKKEKIIAFFKANPYPEDSKIHAFAEKEGISPHDLETQIYGILSDFLTKEK